MNPQATMRVWAGMVALAGWRHTASKMMEVLRRSTYLCSLSIDAADAETPISLNHPEENRQYSGDKVNIVLEPIPPGKTVTTIDGPIYDEPLPKPQVTEAFWQVGPALIDADSFRADEAWERFARRTSLKCVSEQGEPVVLNFSAGWN